MDVTIVIVNWNGGELLHNCLESIRASRSSFAVKVIVVDNDSKDGSREAAIKNFPEFQTFNSGSNLGFGRANNLARPLVTTPLVLFLNPDTVLRPDTLERSVQELLNHPDVGALGCKMLYPSGEVQNQGLQWNPNPWTIFLELLFVTEASTRRLKRWLPLFDPNDSATVRKLYGGYILARKEVLDRAGWFDDRYFMYAEDVDLSLTIRELGWKLYYTSEAEIIHVAGGTSKKASSGFSILMKSESVGKLMRKKYGLIGSACYRAAILFGAALRLLVLMLLRAASFLNGRKSTLEFHNSFFKHRALILWSLGLKRAVIAK